MFQEVLICDRCGSEGCTVHELSSSVRLSMTEFKEQFGKGKSPKRPSARAFEMRCGNCGFIDRFVVNAAKSEKPETPGQSEVKPLKTKKRV